MTEQERSGEGPRPRLKQLRCRRTGELVTPEEHRDCPYCYGKMADVKTGQYEVFCDYEQGKDPTQFGFPEGTSRELHG